MNDEPPDVIWIVDWRDDNGHRDGSWFPSEDEAIAWASECVKLGRTEVTLKGPARRQPGSSEWWCFTGEGSERTVPLAKDVGDTP